jgi:hypothetical protein
VNQTRSDLAITSFVVLALWFAGLFYSVELTKNPSVFADETGYFLPLLFGTAASNYQRWGSSVVEYPSYLYFWLYSFLPKSDLYFWVKMANAIFVVATAIPAFEVSRKYLPRPQALLFAAFVSMMPVASYARYALPESMYFFGFWCTLAIVVTIFDRSIFLAAILGGASLGLLALVKPHAIAIAIPLSLFLAMTRPTLRGLAASAVLSGMCYVAHAGFGFLLTGTTLWSFSTGVYGGILEENNINWGATLLNSSGNVAALFALLGPLMVLPLINLRLTASERTANEIGILALLLVFSMVAMTVYNAQHIFQISPDAIEINELDGRYYLYPLPLFILSAVISLNRTPREDPPRYLLNVCMLTATACSLIVLLFYKVGPVEFPDLTLLGGRSLVAMSIGTILVQFCVAMFFLFPLTSATKIIACALTFVVIEMVTTFGLVFVAPTHKINPNLVDAAFLSGNGAVAKLQSRSDGIVIGSASQAADLARVLFYLRSMSTARVATSNYEFIDSDLPTGANWALLLPGIPYHGTGRSVSDGGLIVVNRPQAAAARTLGGTLNSSPDKGAHFYGAEDQ